MPETILAGFDPGLASTGYGVISVQGSRVRQLEHGEIRTDSASPEQNRLLQIYEKCMAVLEHYAPSAAGIESIFFAKNVGSAIPVAHARGVILLACEMSGITAVSLSPPQIKQRISGVGRAEKSQVQHMVQLLLGMKEAPSSDHAADALAAAYALWQEQGFSGIIQS
ncbi:crossover junction endodeoxyribonuclease RuvC [Salinispira pacifica]|uniref:Crossover junction endodeoxyribonuclease RuvC n=1 Tax=Salinispira pacifica TaxID=1307761 RepID=V5WI33_9SPIO|nr:crossover junction endodeoxyribonuclease RuvC [Salinispira pacifica]AHC15204.1 Crossover junction endodeoxyribonuclease RuvC [Salinispira pacifica]